MSDIPGPCQFTSLCLEDDKRIHNESENWINELKELRPIWSPLNEKNCMGHGRKENFNKEVNYNIEIPNRLLSLFGSVTLHTVLANKSNEYNKYRLVCCAMILFATLKSNINYWSIQFLDDILIKSVDIYKEILEKKKLKNQTFTVFDLKYTYQLENTLYHLDINKAAHGVVYIPYGRDEFNIARALMYFFRLYQFGIIQCNHRSLAIGYAVDNKFGFFMYDCETTGAPLFNNQESNSYILRTNHLQVLLYAIIITLNITTSGVKFSIYNVDIRIEDLNTFKKKIPSPRILATTVHKRFNDLKNFLEEGKTQIPQTILKKKEILQFRNSILPQIKSNRTNVPNTSNKNQLIIKDKGKSSKSNFILIKQNSIPTTTKTLKFMNNTSLNKNVNIVNHNTNAIKPTETKEKIPLEKIQLAKNKGKQSKIMLLTKFSSIQHPLNKPDANRNSSTKNQTVAKKFRPWRVLIHTKFANQSTGEKEKTTKQANIKVNKKQNNTLDDDEIVYKTDNSKLKVCLIKNKIKAELEKKRQKGNCKVTIVRKLAEIETKSPQKDEK